MVFGLQEIEAISLDFGTVDTIEEYNVTFCYQYWHAAGRNNEGGQELGGGSGGTGQTGPTLETKAIRS